MIYRGNGMPVASSREVVMEPLGKKVIEILIADEDKRQKLLAECKAAGMRICFGKAGSMNAEKIIAAVLTASKREGVWDANRFREEHAIYDATLEAMHAVCHGQLVVSEAMRTIGLSFCVIRKNLPDNGEWVYVGMYGTIGAPIKGFEHEAIGLGINHI